MRELLKATWLSYRKHDGPLLSGSIAFYSLLSIAPLAVLTLAIASSVIGEDAAGGELTLDLEGVLGREAAELIAVVVARTREGGGGGVASLLSVLFFVYASTRLFASLQSALNHVWGVRYRPGGGMKVAAKKILRRRMIAFSMLGVVGIGTLVLFVAKAVLSTLARMLEPAIQVSRATRILELGVSTIVLWGAITLVFRFLPDVKIRFRDAAIGGAATAALLVAGGWAIGDFVGRSATASAYGAAGSAIILLLWVYYNAQMFFLGAEFTGIWARTRGGGIRPLAHAVRVYEEDERRSRSDFPSASISASDRIAQSGDMLITGDEPGSKDVEAPTREPRV